MTRPSPLWAFLAVFWVTVGLVSCSSVLNPLSVSEAELEGYLQSQITAFDREQIRSGSPLSVQLKEADVVVGPDGREVVKLTIGGEVAVNALMTRIPVAVYLSVEGTPVLVANERAIYIKRLQLLDSRVESSFFKGDFKPVTDTLMRAVAQLLETMPVYRIDEQAMAGTLLALADLELKVTRGRLVLQPASGD